MLPSKEQVINRVRNMLKRYPNDRLYIYRVGPAWMFTGQSEAETQSHYKVKIREYQEVTCEE